MSDAGNVMCSGCGHANLDIDVRCAACGKPLTSTGVHRMVGAIVMDHYEIVDILGQGGMSVVYKARHRITSQTVALKVLPQELAAHSQVKSRFLEEARALAQLDHPNIVHLHNFGEDNGCLVLIMQYVEGETFERMILTRGRLDWQAAVQVCLDVLDALDYAHGRGIVHRDMKPSNVLVRADTGAATVMDFGIAKMETSSKLTATGQTMGTVRYMSPEQVRGKSVDARTDIYSLGVTLYEAIAGETPFDGDTHFDIMTKHLNEPAPPLSRHGVEVPASVEAIVARALRKPVDERFQSAAELRAALTAALQGRALGVATTVRAPAVPPAPAPPAPARAAPPALAERAGRSRLALGLGLLVAVAAGVVVVATRGGGASGGEPRDRTATAPPPPGDAPPAPAVALPEPFALPDVAVRADRRYDDEQLRVQCVTERDPDQVAVAVAEARAGFAAFLAGRDPPLAIVAPPLNVVVVPDHLICDRRLYESAAMFATCDQLESHYRAAERTLYVVDNDRLLGVNVPSEVALQICVHADPSVQTGCAEAFAEYETSLAERRK